MKKKSTSQSAFFNLRVLVGLFIALAGVSLALLATANPSGRGAPAGHNAPAGPYKYGVTTKSSIDPLIPAGFDCSKIKQLGIDRQENLRAGAIMIFCGQFEGRKSSSSHGAAFSKVVKNLTAPLAYGSTDVDLITGDKSFPNVTQSETFTTANPDDPTQVFVAYNDSRGRNFNPINISGGSFSSDGGTTFTRLTKADGQSPFDNTVGDPVILFHEPSGSWVTVWLDLACGGQGIGGYKSTTPGDPNSWTHYCGFNEGSADRESGWADNNASSPFFGRLYVSWNDFNIGQGALMSIHSTDGGVTWSSPATVINGATFIRDVQITGDLAGSGTVYIAGMDEGGGGFPHQDTNYIFKSTDGGSTWANTYVGTPFPGPGVTAVGYFAQIFNANGGYWRHEGWGEPAAINNFVHLVYDQHGTGSDPADVYYIRSTDGGVTFGTPLKLNTDTTDRPNWQPNLSVSPSGTLLATWYDARVSGDSDCAYGSPTSPCYQMFSRKSNDNGATWLPDDTLSDVVSPLPAQPDPGIQPTYAGDYDYGTALASKHMTSWTDGRNAISGTSQQDAFTDRDLVGFSVATANPACGSLVIGTAPTDFQIILSAPADPATVQASDFTVNGTPADTANLSNGNQTIDFIFNSSPAVAGSNTMDIPAGAIHQASNGDPILEFNCTFRFTVTQLAVTDTVPPVGGTFTPPAPGTYTYDVNWNMPVDPTSVQTTDLHLSGGNTGATVTNVTVTNGNMTTEFTLNIPFGGSLTAEVPAGAINDANGNPNADFQGSYTVEGCPPSQYTITDGTDTIVPGDTDTGNHCDDCNTAVTIPFPFTLYDQTFTTVNVSSNGRLDFVVPNEPGGFVTNCLPAPPNIGPYDFTIFPMWEDLRTDLGLSGCANFPNGTCGVFTSVTGSAPNRIFNIEWRAVYFAQNAATANFEARLYEGDPNLKFEVIIGTVQPGGDHNYVSGVQGNSGAGFFTQDFCAMPIPVQNVSRNYQIPPCAQASPTPTATVVPSATPTSTPTATPTATPTPRVTPRPRPTPHPRPTP